MKQLEIHPVYQFWYRFHETRYCRRNRSHSRFCYSVGVKLSAFERLANGGMS